VSNALEIAEEERKAAMKELKRMIHDKRFGRAKKQAAIRRANAADDAWIRAKAHHEAEAP